MDELQAMAVQEDDEHNDAGLDGWGDSVGFDFASRFGELDMSLEYHHLQLHMSVFRQGSRDRGYENPLHWRKTRCF